MLRLLGFSQGGRKVEVAIASHEIIIRSLFGNPKSNSNDRLEVVSSSFNGRIFEKLDTGEVNDWRSPGGYDWSR